MEKVVGTILGPSAAGKDTVLASLCDMDNFGRIVNDTTRKPRPGEIHGKDYYFVSEYEHSTLKNDGSYITTNDEKGRSYGVRSAELRKAWESDKMPVGHLGMLDHINLWRINDQQEIAVRSIFLSVPDFSTWISRMEQRINSNFISEEELELRARDATREYSFLQLNLGRFAVVLNCEGQLTKAAEDCSKYLLSDSVPEPHAETIGNLMSDFTEFIKQL